MFCYLRPMVKCTIKMKQIYKVEKINITAYGEIFYFKLELILKYRFNCDIFHCKTFDTGSLLLWQNSFGVL